MISKLKAVLNNNHKLENWLVDDADIEKDVLHLYYKGEYYLRIDGFYKSETDLHSVIKECNRDIKINNIIE
jgi:hypothetical protein